MLTRHIKRQEQGGMITYVVLEVYFHNFKNLWSPPWLDCRRISCILVLLKIFKWLCLHIFNRFKSMPVDQMLCMQTNVYRKISNISPPNISPLLSNTKLPPNIPPKIKVSAKFQTRPLNLSKTSRYVNSHQIKRYKGGFRQVLKQNESDFGLMKESFFS